MQRIFLFFFLILATQSLLAQNNAPAGATAQKPDSAAGLLSFNAQGAPEIITHKSAIPGTEHRSVAKQAVSPASPAKAPAKENAAKKTIQVNTAAPVSAEKKQANSYKPPPILSNDNK